MTELHYPEKDWLRVFTDGSQADEANTTWAGVHSKLFSQYATVGVKKSNFNGEIEAISLALQQLLYQLQAFEKVLILVDSKAAIQAVSFTSQPKSKKINDIKQALKHLQAFKKTVSIQWVPSHVGLEGNETADKLAKKGTTLHTKETPLQAESLKELLNCKIATKYKQEAEKLAHNNKKWRDVHKIWAEDSSKPRKEVVVNFRLKTGHDCLATHLRKAGIYESSECTICQMPYSIMGKEHLLHCPNLDTDQQVLKNTIELYWYAKAMMR